jgi:hypothetical protein
VADWAAPLHLDGQGKHSNDQTEDAYAKEPDDPVSDIGHGPQADHQQQDMNQLRCPKAQVHGASKDEV